MKKILVTGGAGYIGSHDVKALCDAGYGVTVLDNLSKGHKGAVDERAEFVEMDLKSFDMVLNLLEERGFDAVMHFAGSTEVSVSMKEPLSFVENNVMNGERLLDAMRVAGVRNIIFSSTAAVYGDPRSIPIKESDSLNPTNVYGVTKLMFEDLLKKYEQFYGIKYVALRYFNAAGADESADIGEDHNPETHLIPNVLKPLSGGGVGPGLKLFGIDYNTKDGTCVRDYIHVTDLVDAHLKALEYLFGGNGSDVFNLGNGCGFTVKEVIKAAEDVTGLKVDYEEAPRRPGDPPVLVADSLKAKRVLKWVPRYTKMEDIIGSAWNWHKKHPQGY